MTRQNVVRTAQVILKSVEEKVAILLFTEEVAFNQETQSNFTFPSNWMKRLVDNKQLFMQFL